MNFDKYCGENIEYFIEIAKKSIDILCLRKLYFRIMPGDTINEGREFTFIDNFERK